MWSLKDEEMATPPAARDDGRVHGRCRTVARRQPQAVTSAGDAPR